MATSYYVKVYYTKQGSTQHEIRRFQIDISESKDAYSDLISKVATFQPEIQLGGFTLQYVDDENERITFSSDAELRSAISTNQKEGGPTPALKVFVGTTAAQGVKAEPAAASQSSTTSTQEQPKGECHVGVECDGCKGAVYGARYKCFVCPNYDLCEACSVKGVHSEHNMIKITRPGNAFHPYGPRPHFPHYYNGGGGSRRWRNREHQREPPPMMGHPPPPHHATGGAASSFMPSAAFFEQIQAQLPHWLPANSEHAQHFRANMQQHFEHLRHNSEAHFANSKQYLESVGKYLQTALSPFGIDCDYHVDEHNKATTPTSTAETAAASSTNDKGHTEGEASSTETHVSQEEEQQQQQPTASAPISEPSTEQKRVDQESSASTTSTSNISSLLNLLRGGNTNAAAAAATTVTPPILASNMAQQIEDCVMRMKQMGFVDNNGSLTELARSKQGDLNLVLDAINPRQHKSD